MKQIFIKPNPKWPLIRDPFTRQFLAAEGEWKPKTTYWVRKIMMGDVLEAQPPVAVAPKKDTTTTKGDK